MSRRRGRDACSPATARRWKLAAPPSESPATARLRIARRQLRPRTFDPARAVVTFDGVEVQDFRCRHNLAPLRVRERRGEQVDIEIRLTHEGPGLRARAL